MCEVPAFQPEPYVDNLSDYLPNVKFQLAEFQNLSRGVDEVLGTWESSADELMKDPNVGLRFNRNSKFRLIQEEVGPLLGANQREQAQYALDRVNEHMDWNGEYRFTSDVSAKDAWKATVGNSAVINMILLGTLRANGIEAEHLLVGLRDDGRPIQEYPVISQFSHLMVLAHLDGVPTIIDANGSRGTVGLPRVRALNGFAWVLSTRNPRWIPIETEQMLQVTRVEATLAESGMATINSTTECLGYFRQSGLSDLEEESDEPEGPILDYYLEKFPDTEFLNRSYGVGENSSDPLNINLQLNAPIGQPSGDYLYFTPVFTNFLQRALVENEERQFPIDFIFPWRKIISTDIQIPEGYVLDELPNNRRIQTENGSVQAHLYFQHFAESNKLAVNFSVRINQDSFHPDDYGMLREIFQEIIDLQEAVIVLKRGNSGDIGANR